ncbi:MAG: zinc ribbon domain-containing protein [Eggerthellaceae bacterium]|jgi:hypothetical protein|nr:zinc ribbon domain-containing protein [Eggerthellaceae bacterium]
MKCVNCGAEFSEGNFCPSCGTPMAGGVAAGIPAANTPKTNASKQKLQKFFDMLKFRDTDPPEEIADSIFWINWLRVLIIVLFWIGIVGTCLASLGLLISGFAGAVNAWTFASGLGLFFGALLGAIVVLVLGVFITFTATAAYMIILNWARDTAFLRSKTK